MSDIEILLQVDAGKIPAGVSAIFLDEEDNVGRWMSLACALCALAGAIVCVFLKLNPAAPTLLVLTAGLLGINVFPTLRAPENAIIKREVAVMTGESILVRDAHGLRQWRLEELSNVVAQVYNRQALLMLIDRRGNEHALRPLHCRRGEQLRALIAQRLRANTRTL
jgi:hypothetical protein